MPRPDLRLLLLLAAIGCGHSDPFRPADNSGTGPFDSTPPLQLTLNVGQDRDPLWLPDGSGVLYAFQRLDRVDRDQCFGVVPAGGGTRRREKCYADDGSRDTTNLFRDEAMSAGGRLAWVAEATTIGRLDPVSAGIRIGTLDPADRGIEVRSLPYLAPNGAVHSTATHLGWLGEDALVYVGTDVAYAAACNGCPPDTLLAGKDVALLNLANVPATVTILPGTGEATAVWPAPDASAIYFTRRGDSQVYRQAPVGGAVTVIHDFGAGRIARDPQVIGTRLVAIVDGVVDTVVVALFGTAQVDSGGRVASVDLGSGLETLLPIATLLFRRPALSPSGQQIVAEGYPLVITPIFDSLGQVIRLDSTITSVADLRLLEP
ncbi:MAG: hypothetical protein ABI742_13080 [Gemmatimonadota bacterium]